MAAPARAGATHRRSEPSEVDLELGSAALVWLILHWRKKRPVMPAVPAGPALQADDPYLRRLRRQLEELD